MPSSLQRVPLTPELRVKTVLGGIRLLGALLFCSGGRLLLSQSCPSRERFYYVDYVGRLLRNLPMGTKDQSVYVTFRANQLDGYNLPSHTDLASKTWKLTRTRTGVNVPNWWTKIANGENATSNLTGTFISLIDSSPLSSAATWRNSIFDAPYKQSAYEGHCAGIIFSPDIVWQNFTSNANAQATARFYKAVREAEIKLSGLVFLGELRETLHMLRRPAQGLQELISRYLNDVSRLKKGKGRGGSKRWSDALSKLWLEYSFGWIPFMSDIEDAKKAYISLFEKDRLIKISAGGKDFKRISNVQSNSSTPFAHSQGFFGFTNENFQDQIELVRYRGVVQAQAVTTSRAQYKRFGFTPSEFIPTAWELLPWSFLVDYFSNIGSILEASVTDTSNVRWLSKTTVQQSDFFGFCTASFNGGPTPGQNNILFFRTNKGSVHYRKRTINRVGNAGISLPVLSFRLPHSDSKLLNVAALLEQVRRRIHHQNPNPRNFSA